MEMLICDSDEKECHLIEDYIYGYYKDREMNVQVRSCGGWQDLCREIKQREADVIILAQNGVKGLDMVTGLKVLTGKLIWFSDLDFGVQAYRLNVHYFNLLPVTREKLEHALHHIGALK